MVLQLPLVLLPGTFYSLGVAFGLAAVWYLAVCVFLVV